MAFDVYSVIRSEEVRDHARKYWDLEPEDKVLLIQTPLMEKPLKCTINSDLDGNYCWYQWLYPRLPEIPEHPGWRIIRRTIWHCQHCGTASDSWAKNGRF